MPQGSRAVAPRRRSDTVRPAPRALLNLHHMGQSSPRRVLTAATLLVSLAGCSGSGTIATAGGFNVLSYPTGSRRPLPAFHGQTLAVAGGEQVTEAFLAGAVGVVNFWGSWCGPCREEEPFFVGLAKEYGPRGVRFLGVDVRDSRAAGIAFRDEFGVPYPSVFSPDAEVAVALRARVMPSTFVVDRRGAIAALITGGLRSAGDLSSILDEELNRP